MQSPRQRNKNLFRNGSFCQIWILMFELIAKPLYKAIKGPDSEPLEWSLQNTQIGPNQGPNLGPPWPRKVIYSICSRKTRDHLRSPSLKAWQHPQASSLLLKTIIDSVATGWPCCLRAVASTALVTEEATKADPEPTFRSPNSTSGSNCPWGKRMPLAKGRKTY